MRIGPNIFFAKIFRKGAAKPGIRCGSGQKKGLFPDTASRSGEFNGHVTCAGRHRKRISGEGSEKEGDDTDNFPEFGERRANMILDGFGRDIQFGSDLLIGAVFATTHAEDLPALFGHLLQGHFDDHHQLFGSDLCGDILRHEVSDPEILAFITNPDILVLEDVEHGIAGHPEKVVPERPDMTDRLSVFPDFEEDVVSEVFGFGAVFQQAERKGLHMRSVTHVQFVKSPAISARDLAGFVHPPACPLNMNTNQR